MDMATSLYSASYWLRRRLGLTEVRREKAHLAAPLLPIADPEYGGYPQLEGPSWEHPFGTDHAGKDIFARVIWGSQVSLAVGLLASVIAAVLGTLGAGRP